MHALIGGIEVVIDGTRLILDEHAVAGDGLDAIDREEPPVEGLSAAPVEATRTGGNEPDCSSVFPVIVLIAIRSPDSVMSCGGG
jgi:hypothetical protein